MTHLYLIRHGIAADRELYEIDEERPLTKDGDRKTRKVAQKLKSLNLKFDIVLSSPLVRARQTADILKSVGLTDHVEEFPPLAPEGEINFWLDWYRNWSHSGGDSLALVGHEPDLGNWAEVLIWGDIREALIVKKAGIIGITLPETGSLVGNSQLLWLTPPKFLLS
ncbi:phosphohistidine phosphatase SixA [Lyngbya aestuarii BL J]|uniref:Phosphohistidine phosphatase SixA n=1 Tax=Lyngbya aestuarii BL J TaxID=1348334 RepID=U7QFP0_9CYAN|nr:phosphohistidine phosphatase SixA [Lyngbya aestuarii]ERT05261.1 phosphohistidine phosphatase SixA [Lyngbya aestuarii BL J]